MIRTVLKIALAVLLADLFTGSPASASAGLMIWPSKVEVSIKAGGAKSGTINVQNQGLNKARLKVQLMNCRMDEDGSIIYTNKNVPSGGKQWLRVEPQEFEILPGASLQLLYAIEVPRNAQGTFMAGILLDNNPQGNGDLQNLPGTLIVGNIPGTGEKRADLTELTFQKGIGGGNASAVLGISNSGSLMCSPTGSLEITDIARGGKTSFAINPEKEPVLPSALRRYRIPLEGLYNGQYKVLAVVDYQGGEILQGEATVTINAGELISQNNRVLPGRAKTQGQPQSPGSQAPPDRQKQTARQTEPKAAPSLSAAEIEELNRGAVKFYSEGDYEKALAQWQKVLGADPGNSGARNGAYRARKKIEALKKARG
jgi:hypothetical protein